MPNDEPPSPKLPTAHGKRLAWALNAYGHLLADAVRQDTSPEAREVEKLSPEQLPGHVARLIQDKADPTVAKTMTGWLVKQYDQGALRLEDLGTAYETLDMFHRYAPRLPKGEQDLGRYPSLAKVWEMVSSIAEAEKDKLSGKAQKVLDKAKAYDESRILRQDEDGFTVAVPLTEFAAKWWGKGTRWCTAADLGNQFDYYNKKAPLIIFSIPQLGKKGKFQLWSHDGTTQFMDASDNPVDQRILIPYWDRIEVFMREVLSRDGRFLAYIPEELRTLEICKIAVKEADAALRYVPASVCTEALCLMAIRQNAWALEHVPEKLMSEKICRIAILKDPLALGKIPTRLRTKELCSLAMRKNPRAVSYVPTTFLTGDDFRDIAPNNIDWLKCLPEIYFTEELGLIALEKDTQSLLWMPRHKLSEAFLEKAASLDGFSLGYMLDRQKTETICKAAVAQRGSSLREVPSNLRTNELCKLAVAQCGWSLSDVPLKLRNEEICRIAVRQNGLALDYVPKPHISEAICEIAVRQNGKALEYVPKILRTARLCQIAIEQNGEALGSVPEQLITETLVKKAVEKNGIALRFVPWKYRTLEVCESAVAQDGDAVYFVPEPLCTHRMYEIAVAKYGLALGYVPKKLRTHDLCKRALESCPGALRYVPETLKTPDLCRIAVAADGRLLEFVPHGVQTQELRHLAVSQNGEALEWVPERMRSPELCDLAVHKAADALHYVPEHLRSMTRCREAIKKATDFEFSVILRNYIPLNMRLQIEEYRFVLEAAPPDLRQKLDERYQAGSENEGDQAAEELFWLEQEEPTSVALPALS